MSDRNTRPTSDPPALAAAHRVCGRRPLPEKSGMREIERLKEEILESYPRLSEKSSFAFACHPAVSCFNDCCGDVNIPLTPYDIVRLKNALGTSSGEFLSKYTVSPFDENLEYPVIFLRMNEDDEKSCPLVSRDGCRVYEARPWPCRMYPLGLASPGEGEDRER